MNEINELIRKIIDKILTAYMALKFSAGQTLESARQEYRSELALVMLEYTESDRPVTAFRNQFRRATNDAFNVVMEAGWADGKGEGTIPDDLQTWVNGEIDKQIGFIDGVFDELKELRKEGDQGDITNFVGARADSYAGTLDGIYAYAKMKGAKDGMGQWRVGPTKESCSTCPMLEGKGPQKLSWFLENNYIPQQNGSGTLECGGWNCLCTIEDPETGKVLVP
jgi:hypothetical protein